MQLNIILAAPVVLSVWNAAASASAPVFFLLLIINDTGWDFAPSGGQLPCGATRVARHWAEVRPSLENKTKCG